MGPQHSNSGLQAGISEPFPSVVQALKCFVESTKKSNLFLDTGLSDYTGSDLIDPRGRKVSVSI